MRKECVGKLTPAHSLCLYQDCKVAVYYKPCMASTRRNHNVGVCLCMPSEVGRLVFFILAPRLKFHVAVSIRRVLECSVRRVTSHPSPYIFILFLL